MSSVLGRLVIAVVLVASAARAAAAQETVRRIEIGATAALTGVTFAGAQAPGLGGWIDVNLSRSLAIEGRVTRISEPFHLGTSINVNAGVRATLVRTRHLDVYGLAMPGVSVPRLGLLAGAPAHFTMDLAAGLAVLPTSRLMIRVEGVRDLHAPRGAKALLVDPSGAVSIIPVPDYIGSRWNVHVGVSYRLGSVILPPSRPGEPARGRWTAGGQLGSTVSTGAHWTPTAGVFVSYRLSSWCDIDASASGFLANGLVTSSYEGGRLIQAVGGLRLGVREGRFGIFFKMRPGVNHDSRVLMFGGPDVGSVTMAVLDIGGVVEANLSRRTLLRIDLGESLSFAHSPFQGDSGPKIYTLPIRVGVGWRF